MSLVRSIEWEGCLLEPHSDRELARRIRAESGRSSNLVTYFGRPSWVAWCSADLNLRLRQRVYVEHHLADLVGLVVSQDNSCRYCFAIQRAAMRAMGYPEQEIRKLEQDLLVAELNQRERAALEFARRVSRSNPLPSDLDLKPLRDAGFSADEMRELAAQIGLYVYFNRLSTLPALPPQTMEALPDKWWARLTRPLMAHGVRALFERSQPVALGDDQRQGPYSEIVTALDGLPVAPALRRILDDCFAPRALPERAPALVFAIVARALGCPKSEQEAVRILAERGLGAEATESVLAHLASPELSPQEAVLVPFARDTVWYGQAAPAQRRAREVRDALGDREAFVEAVATVSLANMVCRLAAALEHCR